MVQVNDIGTHWSPFITFPEGKICDKMHTIVSPDTGLQCAKTDKIKHQKPLPMSNT